MEIKVPQLKKIKYLYLCAALIFFDDLAVLTIGYVTNRFGLRGTNVPQIVFYTAVAVLFLVGVNNKELEVRGLYILLGVFSLLLLFCIYGAIFFPDNFKYDDSGFSVGKLVLYFPAVVSVFMMATDYRELMKYLTVFARVLSVVVIIVFYLSYSRNGNSFAVNDYDMMSGYMAALCGIVLLYSLFDRFRLYDLLMSIAMIVLTSLGGSRGSFLVICVYLAIMLFNKFLTGKKLIFKVLFILVVGILIIVIYNYYTVWLTAVVELLDQLGIQSRTLNSFLSGSIAQDSGRSELCRKVISSWRKMPAVGYGLLGDRATLDGVYVHNIVLEMITDFGFLLGGLLLALLAIGTVKKIVKRESRGFMLLLISYTVTMLMISFSYINSTFFYILIGAIASRSRPADISVTEEKNMQIKC